MTKKPQVIIFRADASVQIGTGHIMRCLTLADALREQGAECHFVCREHPGNLIETIRKRGFPVHALPLNAKDTGDGSSDTGPAHAPWLGVPWETDARQSGEILRELDPTWVVVDHYALDARWEAAVRPKGGRLLVIDDLADRPHEADLLLDQNLGRQFGDYASLAPENCRLLIGPHYALLRPEFARLRKENLRRCDSPRLKRLLVTMGGVDKDNATGKVLDSLRDCPLPDNLEIDAVMGSSAPWLKSIQAQAAAMPWPTEVRVNVHNLAQLMADADLAIGAAGSTSWERCCLGLPTLMLALAANQRGIAEALASAEACIYLGDIRRLKELPSYWEEWTNSEALRSMSQASASITDGEGTRRVCQNMMMEG